VDGFPGFRIGGTFGPDNVAGLRAGERKQAGDRKGKKRFSVHSQACWFPNPKMAKKSRLRKQFDAFCVLNYANFRLTLLFCL
jgi:hypothetical protein